VLRVVSEQNLLWLAQEVWRNEPCSAERNEELGKRKL